MRAIDLRNKYIAFFERHGHAYIPSAPLVPENDPSVLFTPAGMHPLVPYLLGEKHPAGTRLVDYQKCVRTIDIDDVGDASHLTFFEMLGNWSLGDYFKEESISMSFEFLTKELEIPIKKIHVTVFEGDEVAPRDELSARIWEEKGIPVNQIYYLGKKHNWWQTGNKGPCGPDTEIFYDTGKPACSDECSPACDCGKYVEIWNNVFMEYYQHEDGTITKLSQQNVDTGLGLERVTFILQGKQSVFETEIFKPVMDKLEELSKNPNVASRRIISDHVRTAMMLILDGVRPSNVEQGYVLRRIIRRAIRHLRKLGIEENNIIMVAELLINTLSEMYPELVEKKKLIIDVLGGETHKFLKTLANGEKEFEKAKNKLIETGKDTVKGEIVFRLYDTYGFPVEITEELAKENNLKVDIEGFEELFKKHQELSRAGTVAKFKGGLSDNSEKSIQYHTATHLLHKALQMVLGPNTLQKGSNITGERLRFDFSHPQKVTAEELKQVEDIVNEQIQNKLDVVCEEMSFEEAKNSGATGLFENKYGNLVKVYSIGNFSKEICGGPHVKNTSELGTFKIKKEEASSSRSKTY